MNRLLCAASILALVVPAAAIAQHQGDRQHGQGGHQAQTHQGRGGGGSHQGRGNAQRQATPTPQAQRPTRETRTVTQTARPQRTERPVTTRSNVRTVSNQRPGGHAVNVRRVRAPAFRYPSGYRYRHWSAGSILPAIFLSNYYFYNNWAAVGAYPPPPGFVWVRYGPDLLLVSRRSGRIRDVIYGVFY